MTKQIKYKHKGHRTEKDISDMKIISRNYKYKVISINWMGRIKGKSKFKIKELGSKYLFSLIYCFIEKNLLNLKK